MHYQRNQLLPPSKCDNCEGPNVGLTSNSVIYGTPTGTWPYCYYCDDCGAMVGCHANTHYPLGRMANGTTRRLRARLHDVFDPIWRLEYLSRGDAYKWLEKELDLAEECHISQLTKDQLKAAIKLLTAHKSNDYALFKRRKEKNVARKYARARRQGERIAQRKSNYKLK